VLVHKKREYMIQMAVWPVLVHNKDLCHHGYGTSESDTVE
jgi:hypothetical protein